jgi:hypothetical protein
VTDSDREDAADDAGNRREDMLSQGAPSHLNEEPDAPDALGETDHSQHHRTHSENEGSPE